MQPVPATLARVLRLLVAALTLLGGEGLHLLQHEGAGHHESGNAAGDATGHTTGDAAGDATTAPLAGRADGPTDAHAGDCEHRQELPAPHAQACLLCKVLPANAGLLAARVAVGAFLRPASCAAAVLRGELPAAFVPGVLGARGPPVMTA